MLPRRRAAAVGARRRVRREHLLQRLLLAGQRQLRVHRRHRPHPRRVRHVQHAQDLRKLALGCARGLRRVRYRVRWLPLVVLRMSFFNG